ncbi:MAG: Hpt domain-containing protein [Treponema sp.]|jgi:two-component system chemotaxis sensor kinase CheA|nr:Hpt domain-containing protein [Treponema sp.]
MTKQAAGAKKSPNLLFQFNLFCIFFIAVIISVMAVTALQQMHVFSARLGLPVTTRVAASIDGDRFEELSRTLDGEDPYYEETRLWMYALKQDVNCLYLYTMAPVSDTLYRYIIDGSAPPGEEGFSPLGAEEDISGHDKAFLRTMETGTAQISELDYQKGWGWLISTYTPIFNSRGGIVGIIGCDFEVLEVFRILWQQIVRQTILPFIIIIIALAFYFPMIRGINRLTGNLKAERDEIAVMKDSLKAGLFLMNRDYIIQPQYSRALESVLEESNLQGRNFVDLLSDSLNPKERESLKKYFNIFQKDKFRQELLDELNPLVEFDYIHAKSGKEKTLRCVFALVEREAGEKFILGSLVDVTAEVELRRQLAKAESKQQEEMRSIFEIIHVDPAIFKDFLEDMEYEFEQINETMKDQTISAHDAMDIVFQSVHAIKSNALIIGLKNFSEKVHELESEIKKLKEQENISTEGLLHLTVNIEKIMKESDSFKAVIDKIQSFYFQSMTMGMEKNQEQRVLIETLSRASRRTAEDLEKKVRFEVSDIDSLALEQGPRRVIKEVLLQLVRNSVCHGIESPAERRSAGKDEEGSIGLSITVRDGKIHVRLQDDGRGLNFEQIRKKAEKMRILRKDQKTDKSALLKVIFAPGFSTVESGGLHGGRGAGLNLVRDRIRNLGGSIKLQTTPGKGTVFNIFIPLEMAELEDKIS